MTVKIKHMCFIKALGYDHCKFYFLFFFPAAFISFKYLSAASIYFISVVLPSARNQSFDCNMKVKGLNSLLKIQSIY